MLKTSTFRPYAQRPGEKCGLDTHQRGEKPLLSGSLVFAAVRSFDKENGHDLHGEWQSEASITSSGLRRAPRGMRFIVAVTVVLLWSLLTATGQGVGLFSAVEPAAPSKPDASRRACRRTRRGWVWSVDLANFLSSRNCSNVTGTQCDLTPYSRRRTPVFPPMRRKCLVFPTKAKADLQL